MIRVLAAAAATVVLAASPTAAGGRGAALTVAATSVQARSSSAAIGWQASATAKVVVAYGLTDDFGVWTKPQLGRSGQALLAGLEPNTTYRFRLIARTGTSRAESSGTFTTGPIAAWTTATTTRNALFLDWQPFFPRMVWKACPVGLRREHRRRHQPLHGQLRERAAAARGARRQGVLRPRRPRRAPAWTAADSSAGTSPTRRTTPARRSQACRRSKQSRRVSFITLSNHFFSAANPLPQGNPSYPKLIAPVDSVGFDLYPLQIWCRTDAYQAVFQAQRELDALAAGKPTFQWIEAATFNGCDGKPRSPTAPTVRAETWLAIAGGARGIGYFPYYWSASIAKEIASINRQITALAPALLGPERR